MLPPNTKAGQVLQVMVPAGYPQAGQMAKFQVPEGVQPGVSNLAAMHAQRPVERWR